MSPMKNKLLVIASVLIAIVATAGGTVYAYWDQAVRLAGMAINHARSWSASSCTTTAEQFDAKTGAYKTHFKLTYTANGVQRVAVATGLHRSSGQRQSSPVRSQSWTSQML